MKSDLEQMLLIEGYNFKSLPADEYFQWQIIVEVPTGSLMMPEVKATTPVQIIKRKEAVSLVNFMASINISEKSDIHREFKKIKNPGIRESTAMALQEKLLSIPEIRVTVLLDDDSIPSFIAFEEESHEDALLAYDLFHRLRRLANCSSQLVTHLRSILFLPLLN